MNPSDVRRVLIVRPRFLGDVCLTLPLLDAVRAACPGAAVGYVVERGLAPLLAGDPRLEAIIDVVSKPSPAETWTLVRRMRRFRPDVVIDCFCNPRTAVWTWGSGAPVRVGYPNKGWRSALYTHHSRPRTLSATGFHMAALPALGWTAPATPGTPRLTIAESARGEARDALARLGVPAGAMLVGMHPGATWPTRRWDPANFVELGRRWLATREDAVVLYTAGPGEEDVARACAAALPGGRAFPVERMPLPRFVALQSLCAAFVCSCTGPLHTAVAAGTRTLGLMSRNRPAMFFPYPESEGHRCHYARVECSPCHRDHCDDLRCLTRMTADRGWELLREVIGAPAGA